MLSLNTPKKFNRDAAIHFIKHQQRIRAFVDDYAGFGDIITVFHLIERFRNEGFSGWFELVYAKGAAIKITKLLGIGFDFRTTQRYYLHDEKIEAISLSFFLSNFASFEKLPLAFSGGLGNAFSINQARLFKCQVYFNLPPSPDVDKLYTKLFHHDQINPITIDQEQQPSALIFPIPSLQQARKFLLRTSRGKRLLKQKPLLLPIIDSLKQSKINTLSVYGMNVIFDRINPSYSIVNQLLGICEIQHRSPSKYLKPTLIILHNELSLQDMEQLRIFTRQIFTKKRSQHNLLNKAAGFLRQKFSINISNILGLDELHKAAKQCNLENRLRIVDVTHNRTTALPELYQDDLIVINLGNIPYQVFEPIFTHSTFPPVREGESSRALLLNAKKSNIYCRGRLRSSDAFLDNITDAMIIDITQAASNQVCTDTTAPWQDGMRPDHMIADYIKASFEPQNPVFQQSAKQHQHYHDPSNDRILYIVDQVRQQYQKAPLLPVRLYKELCDSIRNGNLTLVKDYISQNSTLNAPDLMHPAPLAVALKHREPLIVIELLAHGAKQPFYMNSTDALPWEDYSHSCRQNALPEGLAPFCYVELYLLSYLIDDLEAFTKGNCNYVTNQLLQFVISLNQTTTAMKMLTIFEPARLFSPLEFMPSIATKAVAVKNMPLLHKLISMGSPVGMLEIINAIYVGDLEFVKFLLDNCDKPLEKNEKFLLAQTIISADTPEILSYLLQVIPKFNEVFELSYDSTSLIGYGVPLIHRAASAAKPEICRILADKFTNVCDPSTLIIAVTSNNLYFLRAAKAHQKCNFNILVSYHRHGEIPLFLFAKDSDLLSFLLHHISAKTCQSGLQTSYYRYQFVPDLYYNNNDTTAVLCELAYACGVNQLDYPQIACPERDNTKARLEISSSTLIVSELYATCKNSFLVGLLNGSVDELFVNTHLDKFQVDLLKYPMLLLYGYYYSNIQIQMIYIGLNAIKNLLADSSHANSLLFGCAQILFDIILDPPNTFTRMSKLLLNMTGSVLGGTLGNIVGKHMTRGLTNTCTWINNSIGKITSWCGFYSTSSVNKVADDNLTLQDLKTKKVKFL